MTAHADILDQTERLSKPFWTSIGLHIAVIGAISAAALIKGTHLNIGDPNGGGIGSVAVTPVASIPLPSRGGLENPVANDTESMVPAPPKAAPKALPKVKPPSPKAISLKSDKATPKKPSEAASSKNTFREKQPYEESRLYSTGGQRLESTAMQIQGSGTVGTGNSSPFGTQFGSYATIIRDSIARKWVTSDINAQIRTAPAVVVTFRIMRDGSVSNAKVSERSGISPLDTSALRAVSDAGLPPLPAGFPRDYADVELRFELKR